MNSRSGVVLRVFGIGALVAGGVAVALAALAAVILIGPVIFWVAWNVLDFASAVGLPELGFWGIVLAVLPRFSGQSRRSATSSPSFCSPCWRPGRTRMRTNAGARRETESELAGDRLACDLRDVPAHVSRGDAEHNSSVRAPQSGGRLAFSRLRARAGGQDSGGTATKGNRSMATKRQTTMAKLQRERKVQEKREKKLEKKQAAAAMKQAIESGELPEGMAHPEPVEDERPNLNAP